MFEPIEAHPDDRPSPRRSPRRSQAQLSQDDAALALEKRQAELDALAEMDWCGQAEKLGSVEKEILSHFVHRIVKQRKLADGGVIDEPVIKYTTEYEQGCSGAKERVMSAKGMNVTRMGEYLLKLDSTPDDVKEKVARKMRSNMAKEFVKALESKRRRLREEADSELDLKRKQCKVDGEARTKADEREYTIKKYLKLDPAMPKELFDVAFYFLSLCLMMCRIPFFIVENKYFIQFLWALRPNFVKMLPTRARKVIASDMVDELYEEALLITDEKLKEYPGKLTLGMDGHKIGRRHVETLTRAKLGISTMLNAEMLGSKRATGQHLAELAFKHLDNSYIAVVADNTGNNTGSRKGLFAMLLEEYPTLLCIGCCVHVLDLLIEDLAKVSEIEEAGENAHFIVTFVKKHGVLYEEFLQIQKSLGLKRDLITFPLTRFAYMHLMCSRVAYNYSALRLVSESNVFRVVKAQMRMRGERGKKAVAEFRRFEDLVGTRSEQLKIAGANTLLSPFSQLLHYLESDSTPISHTFCCYQLLYDYAQEMSSYATITDVLTEEQSLEDVLSAVRNRWLGSGRKVGLKDDLHLCAFALDPYIQATMCTEEEPECDLLSSDVASAARNVFRHLAGEDTGLLAMLTEQFGLWCACAPQNDGGTTARSGNNAFSTLRMVAMKMVWDKIAALNRTQIVDSEVDVKSPVNSTRLFIAKLKACSKPTDFWLQMRNEPPRGADNAAKQAHRSFCQMACNIVAVVGHTAGVERAGKGYGLVLTSLRQAMDKHRAVKSVVILENYGLIEKSQESGSGYLEFVPAPEDEQVELIEGIPRGSFIMDDVPDSDAGGDDEEDASGEEGAEEEEITRVPWGVPTGFVVAPKPTAIDATVIGQYVFLNWKDYGWQLGKVTALITSATPRLVKKYNVRVTWMDEHSGPTMLDLNEYKQGSSAPTDAWVFLVPTNAQSH